ncbi:MAG TPA: MBL fold metallo-hydrolase [Candidatus Mediterraneibacter intestinavium]|nr:MBL fold metallo-hydrolase [Candidatus Mediterraneibacter intestinavium]
MMKVTYLGHSGFFVEMEDACFLFDYYKGELPEADRGKKLFVFVSHGHYDHYRKEIFSLRDQYDQVRCLISSDIFVREAEDILSVKPNEETEVLGCRIRTLRSTDEGVAFLLKYRGRTIYHAGDLNWWHWEEETEEYNTAMRRAYQSEINKLQGEKIDLAFVPVDPRLGEQYCWGLDCFMKRTDTKRVFPMHFWDNYAVFDRLALEKCAQDYEDRIIRIEREGQSFLLE